MHRLHHVSVPSFCLSAMAWLGMAALTMAQEPPARSAAEDVSLLRPFVGETTFLVVKVDPSAIALPALDETVVALSPDAAAGYTDASRQLAAVVRLLQTATGREPIYATAAIPISKAQVPVYVFCKKPAAGVEPLVALLKNQLRVDAAVRGDYLVATPDRFTLPSDFGPAGGDQLPGKIEAGLRAVEKYPAKLLVVPPEHVWRTVRELAPELPPQLGGGSSRVLTDGVQWAALGMDPGKLRAELVVQSADEEAARQFAEHLPRMLRAAFAAAGPDENPPVQMALQVIGGLKPTVEESQVHIHIDGLAKTSANVTLLTTIARSIEDRFRRRTDENRFKQILLAMHNYHDTHGSFPPADEHRDPKGKHRLSWRVLLLPYLEQQALYQQFRLDEPWDSPHNKPLVAKIPEVFGSDSFTLRTEDRPQPGYTTFLAPVGTDTVFGGAKSTKFSSITDGTSNTVVLVEVTPARAVPWTAPQDYQFDPSKPLDGVRTSADGQWLCGFADGSVSQLPGDIAAEMVLRLFQMNDGQPVDRGGAELE